MYNTITVVLNFVNSSGAMAKKEKLYKCKFYIRFFFLGYKEIGEAKKITNIENVL